MNERPEILVIDDNSVDRESIRRLVEERFSVSEAATASEGVKRCQAARPQCVLVDFRLPDRSGSEILGELLAEDVPVIMLTGQGNEVVAADAMKRGAHDYLVKDRLTSDSLRRAIQHAIERRALERQVQAAQRMEAVGRLAGGVAHDFNNFLTVIQGYVGILMEQFPQGEAVREDLTAIREAAESAAQLTSQLLAFSRRQPQELRVLDVNAVVRDLDRMLRRVIGEDIDLVARLADELALVRTDVTQMEQVLLNLVVNARDAMPRGGKITLETANVELDTVYGLAKGVTIPPGRYVMIAVTDTGVGIPAAVQERIFEPFFTTKERGRGTGLGLATTYGIVKQSGGYIWVYSEVGEGATFKVYLPRVEGVPDAVARPSVATPVGGNETILLVEDEQRVREVATRILERAGYRVLPAGHGEEALSLAERHEGPIQLLITDIVMPNMSGKALADRLAEVRPDTPVVYMSGYTDNAIVHHGVLDEGTAYVQKPFTPDGLLRKVREVMDG